MENIANNIDSVIASDGIINKTNKKLSTDAKKLKKEVKQHDIKFEEIDKLIKSLGSSNTNEEKIQLLAKNLITLEKELKKSNTVLKQNERQIENVQREKEQLQKDFNKGILIKDKLEQVCREQQKFIKSIKSENMSKIKDEEEKRKETQQHFQKSINEICVTLDKNNAENAKLKEANLEMSKKFKYLSEQYDLRDKQIGKMSEQVKLESELNTAKLAKAQMEATIEKEILLKEKQCLQEDLLSCKKTIFEMQSRENLLREQLALYSEKYEGFHTSLQKNNDIFITYKAEIEKMSKNIKSLEKENYEWKLKYQKCNKTLLEMATDKQMQDQYVGKATRQLAQMQKLCRTLQAEKTSLIDVLKANNIDRPPMPELPPEPIKIVSPPQQPDKLDMMSKNCNELKSTLAELQNQMNALSNKVSTGKTTKSSDELVPAEKATTVAGEEKKTKKKKNKTKSSSIKEQKQQQQQQQQHQQQQQQQGAIEQDQIDIIDSKNESLMTLSVVKDLINSISLTDNVETNVIDYLRKSSENNEEIKTEETLSSDSNVNIIQEISSEENSNVSDEVTISNDVNIDDIKLNTNISIVDAIVTEDFVDKQMVNASHNDEVLLSEQQINLTTDDLVMSSNQS